MLVFVCYVKICHIFSQIETEVHPLILLSFSLSVIRTLTRAHTIIRSREAQCFMFQLHPNEDQCTRKHTQKRQATMCVLACVCVCLSV